VPLGEHASCYKGAVILPGRKHPAASAGGFPGTRHQWERRTYDPVAIAARGGVATLVSFLGLPADPTWAEHVLGIVERKKRIEEIGDGLRSRILSFPERNGPIVWPRLWVTALLTPHRLRAGSLGDDMPAYD
jgi:hypothetical protein